MRFSDLGLASELLLAIEEEGYTCPTPIQVKAIPLILSGNDILAAAQTGTGKTAAFTLPVLHRLKRYANHSASPARHPIRALILTPTRELADQVHKNVLAYGRYLPLRAMAIFGGVNITGQIAQLQSGVEILVATPGRLLDHLQQKIILLNQVELLVLDEADRMLDMGFIQDIRRIIEVLPNKYQTLLFSATFSSMVKNLAETLLSSPTTITVAEQNTTSNTITQQVYLIAENQKFFLLTKLIAHHQIQQVIIFCRTKEGAEALARRLNHSKIAAQAIHGDRPQKERLTTLAAFKSAQLAVLVATDVAARGLDVEALPFVINYELSANPEDYVHRIGRTGRAGTQGVAITLISAHEIPLLEAVRQLTKQALPILSVEDELYAKSSPAQFSSSYSNRETSALTELPISHPILLGNVSNKPQTALTSYKNSKRKLPALLLPPPKIKVNQLSGSD